MHVCTGAVSAFATLLFLIQLIFTGSLIGWNEEIIDADIPETAMAQSPMMGSAQGFGVLREVGSVGGRSLTQSRTNSDGEDLYRSVQMEHVQVEVEEYGNYGELLSSEDGTKGILV